VKILGKTSENFIPLLGDLPNVLEANAMPADNQYIYFIITWPS